MRALFLLSLIFTAGLSLAGEPRQATCDSYLLVSSWKNNQVAIYNGCDHRFIRYLDESGAIQGPQAIFQDHNNDVILISEGNHQLIKYDGNTLEQKAVVIPAGQIQSPISAVREGSHHVLIFSYAENSIHRYDMRNWHRQDTLLEANNPHLKGIDLNPNFGPDGGLYVPGYDSNNIIRIDPKTKQVSQWVSKDLGINRPRAVFWHGDHAYVSAWGNSNIFEFNQQGQITRIMFPMVTGPSALIKDGQDSIFIASDRKNSVYRYRFTDGSVQPLIKEDNEHLDGSTHVYRLMVDPYSVD